MDGTAAHAPTLERRLTAARVLAACSCLAPIGVAVPLHEMWTLAATLPGKPEYHHVVMSSWDEPLPWRLWRLWFTCASLFVVAATTSRRIVRGNAERLLACLVCVVPAVLLALHHALPRLRFTTVQGSWVIFAGAHEYVPVFLCAAAVMFVCARSVHPACR